MTRPRRLRPDGRATTPSPRTGARSFSARGGPDVDVALGCEAVDLAEFVDAELEVLERGDVRLELLDAAGTDHRGSHPAVAKHPGDRHLGQALSAPSGDLGQPADLCERLLVDLLRRERFRSARPR